MPRQTKRIKRASRYLDQVAYAIDRNEKRIKFECKRCAHQWWDKRDLPSEGFARMMLDYWKKPQGVVTHCPKCDDPKTGRPRPLTTPRPPASHDH